MKKIRFTDERINALFNMLKSYYAIKDMSFVITGFTDGRLHPIDIDKSFANPAAVKDKILSGRKANAYAIINAGHDFENYSLDKKSRSMDERKDAAIKEANELI